MQDVWVLKSVFFLFSGHVTYHIWCDSLNVTEEEPLNPCLTHSQTFVIVSGWQDLPSDTSEFSLTSFEA